MDRNMKIMSKIVEADWQSHWTPNHDNLDFLILDHLIYEGQLETATIFANNKGLPLNIEPFHKKRNEIRNLIEKGLIDDAISNINDIHSNFLDTNINVYTQLLAQKVNEMIFEKKDQEVIIQFMRDELAPLMADNENLKVCLEDLMEYLVFGEGNIQVKRNHVAGYVNSMIMEKYKMEDSLKKLVSDVVNGEKNLAEKHQFPRFESYCNKSKE